MHATDEGRGGKRGRNPANEDGERRSNLTKKKRGGKTKEMRNHRVERGNGLEDARDGARIGAGNGKVVIPAAWAQTKRPSTRGV